MNSDSTTIHWYPATDSFTDSSGNAIDADSKKETSSVKAFKAQFEELEQEFQRVQELSLKKMCEKALHDKEGREKKER